MVEREYTDLELQLLVLNFLFKRRRWGRSYFPVDTLIRYLSRAVKNDGKRVKEAVRKLLGAGFLLPHKKGNVVSLNPARSSEIAEVLKEFERR